MASRTGFIYHDRFLEHNTGPGHPERAERLRSMTNYLKETGTWQHLQHVIIDQATDEDILRVHTADHLRFVRDACRAGRQVLDGGDTHACSESYEIAMLAAGGVLAGVDAVARGLLNNAFCAVRPPGHHAERNAVMGFCLFNNVAIAARYAKARYNIERVAIIDWDVHHGNGTQEIFYEDRSVFYISLHQYPFYPGTGSREERGSGAGIDHTLNIPMRAGSGETEYLSAFATEILPALDAYRPDFIILSAGFDAHKDDPLANINLTEASFAKMTDLVREAADKYCGGKLLSVLEGGYNVLALARCIDVHVLRLMA